MIDIQDFRDTVDNKFWSHINKETLLLSTENRTKEKIISEVVNLVNDGKYVPNGVRGFLIFNKSRDSLNRIARIVPSFYPSDYIFLYYLLKKLEEELSMHIHPNAFGSFRNFKFFRDKEIGNHELLGYEYLPSVAAVSSYHKNYWIFEWKEFLGKARRLFQNSKYKYFISFDIADFYPSINLLLLERKVRSAVPREKQTLVDLLFYFLQYSNNKFKRYVPEIKGIPQDEVGDLSRVLANFFLQDFDHEINNFAKQLNSEVLRYADDHIIYAPDEKSASSILFFASIQLQKIGLTVNSGKVHDYKSRGQFSRFWSFDIHELLDQKKWKLGAQKYLERNKNEFRWPTVLFRFLGANTKKINSTDYSQICKEFLSDSLVSNMKHSDMLRLYYFLPKSERDKFLVKLYRLSKNNNFNSFHYNLLKAINKDKNFSLYFDDHKRQLIKQRIDILKKFFN